MVAVVVVVVVVLLLVLVRKIAVVVVVLSSFGMTAYDMTEFDLMNNSDNVKEGQTTSLHELHAVSGKG